MLENLPYFQRHLPDDLAKVNAVINQAVQSDVALISQIGTYIISAGGKRLVSCCCPIYFLPSVEVIGACVMRKGSVYMGKMPTRMGSLTF